MNDKERTSPLPTTATSPAQDQRYCRPTSSHCHWVLPSVRDRYWLPATQCMRCLSLILILTVTFVASCFAKFSRSSASHCKTHASRETAAPHAELHDSSFACSFVALHILFYQRSYPSVFGAVKFASFHYSLLVGIFESRDVCAASAIERIIGDSSGLPLESYTKTTPPGWQTGHVHYPFIRYL